MQRVEYRRADTPEEKEVIYRERYDAYRRDGSIEENAAGIFTDPADESPNVWILGVYIDGELASSIRLHIGWRPEHFLPVTKIFSDVMAPRLRAGQMIIDSTRQVSGLRFVRNYPFLTLLTMTASHMADDHFEADYMTAACKPEYQAAFRRLGGCVEWAPPRPYPPLAKPTALMGYECQANRKALRERYPFILTTPAQRRALFGRTSTVDRDFQAEWAAEREAFRSEGRQKSTTWVA
jgi:hypothetical protein